MTNKHIKTIEQQYQVLSDIEHLKKRISIYAGSPILDAKEEYQYSLESKKMKLKNISYIPALIKAISEAIDNVVDEHKRNPEKTNQLTFTINDSECSIWNNGGIPVVIHKDLQQYIPEIVFCTLRSSSNYDDTEDSSKIGVNGVGVKILNAVSEYFIVETADGVNYFKQEFTEGMNKKSTPIVKPSTKNYTQLTFKPDLEYFKLKEFDDGHYDKVLRRLLDVSACNPNLKVYFNGELLKVKDFNSYVDLYYPESNVFISEKDWDIGLASSSGYNQTSFVNSVETYMGGTHVDYVLNQIITKLREYFKKKHKVDVKPADIKAHLHIFISCNINRPKFSSQSKENMISLVSDFGSSWECTDKFIKKVIELEAIQNILDWVKAKEQANLNAELRKHNKSVDKSDPKNVENFHDATTKNRQEATLLIVEGLSALSGVLSGRDTKKFGIFPLKGKPINVFDMDIKKVLENEELSNIRKITGLQLGKEIDTQDLYFGKMCVLVDADLDAQHLKNLIYNIFYKYWKEAYELGLIYVFETPIKKVIYKKSTLYFYTEHEFEEWASLHKNESYTHKHLKGLGSSNSVDWKHYFTPEVMQKCMKRVVLSKEDEHYFELLFSKKKADERKTWLDLEECL